MNCIAIDDEPKGLAVIERYCEKINFINIRASFREPVKAIEFLNREKVDLVFLDINMPGINGMQLINALTFKPMVIFTTAYTDYAVESYNLNAVDYLLKPITFERFLNAANKAWSAFLKQNKPQDKSEAPGTVFLKSGPKTYQVSVDDILYLEKDGNYITVHLEDKEILIRENLTDIFNIIPPAGFIRIHKSFVVAIKHITLIEVQQVIINNQKIPIGSTYRELLKEKLGLH
jgi:two-component system LytT family response regulator